MLKFAPARSAASRIALARARDAVYPTLGAGNAGIPSPKERICKDHGACRIFRRAAQAFGLGARRPRR